MLDKKTIAVVVPAYNEARLLPRTLAGMPGFVDHVVVIDDASLDETAQVVREISARDGRVVLLEHVTNQGVGAAIVSGYTYCRDQGFDVTVVMGADDQMHPDDMPSLLLPVLRDEADYVCGDRLSWPGGWRAFPPVRLTGVLVLGRLTRWSTGFEAIRDAQCGYTAISLAALHKMPLKTIYPRYGFPNDMLAKAAAMGLRVVTRPVRPIYGDEVSSMRVPAVLLPILTLVGQHALERARRSISKAPTPSSTAQEAHRARGVHVSTPARLEITQTPHRR